MRSPEAAPSPGSKHTRCVGLGPAETPALTCPSARAVYVLRPDSALPPAGATARPEGPATLGSPALTDGPGCEVRDEALPGVAASYPVRGASANRKHGYRHSPILA